MTRLMAVAALVVVLGGTARAQVVQGEDRVVYLKKTILDLGGGKLEGRHEGPGELLVQVRGKPVFQSHIALRKNFTPELNKSVDNL